MGKFYYNETGRMIRAKNEEITRWAWARKDFDVATSATSAELYLFLYEYAGNQEPLRVEINGSEHTIPPYPEAQGMYSWRTVPIAAGVLRQGENQVIFRSENPAMSAWILGLESANLSGASFKSTDQGETWQNQRLGYDFSMCGEYLVRLWTEEPAPEPSPPEFIHERFDHPRLAELRDQFPLDSVVAECRDDFSRAVALRSFVRGLLTRQDAGNRLAYCPWDFSTIPEWGKREEGHGADRPIRFCVHASAAFAQACLAIGLSPRLIVLDQTSELGTDGHFVAEVWCREMGKWVMMDTSGDLHLELEGNPLNVLETHRLWEAGRIEEVQLVRGPHAEKNPHTAQGFFERHLRQGGYKRFGLLPRNDFFSHPEAFPVEHGLITYHQTDFVWWKCSRLEPRRYFPFHCGDEDWFNQAPAAERGIRSERCHGDLQA